MEPAEARPPAEPFENVDAFEAAAAEYPEADHAEPQSAAAKLDQSAVAQLENGAGADIEGAPPEGLNGLPLSKSQAKKRAKYEARQAQKAERKEREKRHVSLSCKAASCTREEHTCFRANTESSMAMLTSVPGWVLLAPSQLLSLCNNSHTPNTSEET